MSGHQYLSNSNNLFEDDDVDDETFLKNSRRGTNPFEEPQQLDYVQRTREIEERTLASSNRSLGLLYETEQVGIATAEELARQRDQLENTNKQLDDINSTLRFSQKHLNGLKSIFGGLKNYISGQKEFQTAPPSQMPSRGPTIGEKLNSPTSSYNQSVTATGGAPNEDRYTTHPMARLRSDNNTYPLQSQQQQQAGGSAYSFNKQLDKNLDEMAGSLSRLKGLALDLHTEIDDQNDLIDNITNKVENVDVKIGKQNKEINHLLGKK